MTAPSTPEPHRDDLAPSKVDRLVAILEQALRTGQFVAGDRFLSTYEVARDYGVSPGTARKAMGLLVTRGYLQNSERSGFFLRPAGAELSRETHQPPAIPSPIVEDTTDTLLVLVGTIAEGGRHIFADYLAALRQAASLRGWQVVQINNTSEEISRANRQYRILTCLAYCLLEPPAGPIDFASTIIWGRAEDWQYADCSIMSVDTHNAARLVYEHLWDHGHLKTAHVRPDYPNVPNANTTGMILGMRQAYHSLGHQWTPDDVIVVTPQNIDALYQCLCAAGITGICCESWEVTVELYRQAAQCNEQIGDRLALVTVGGHDDAQTLQPAPSRICWRAIDLASTVMEAMTLRKAGKPMPRLLNVPVFLEEGSSTRSMFTNHLQSAGAANTAG